MDWYYAINDRQLGPVSREQLDELRSKSVIGDATLVWRDGMKDWLPFHEAMAATPHPADHRMCAECRKFFPPTELIRLNHTWICAACKPRFLQKMLEGLVPPAGVSEVWRRGRQLVFRVETPFPDRCLRCNQPANGHRARCHVLWTPTGRFVLSHRRLEIQVGLCERHLKLRDRITVGCWIGALLCFAVFIFGLVLGINAAAAALLPGIFATGLAVASRTLISPTKVTDGLVRARGAGKPFLASLPEWPGDR